MNFPYAIIYNYYYKVLRGHFNISVHVNAVDVVSQNIKYNKHDFIKCKTNSVMNFLGLLSFHFRHDFY